MSLNRFDLMSETNRTPNKTAKLLYISASKYGKDWHSVLHTHLCAELFYVTGGKGSFVVGKEVFPVAKGDLVVVNPQVEHTETGVASSPLEYIVLGVDGLELSLGQNGSQQYHLSHLRNAYPQVQHYLQDMLREISGQAVGYEAICENILNILIILLTRDSGHSTQLIPAAAHARKDSATVRRYINNHFKDPLTLDQLADLVHTNKYHMVHNFTRDYGISPIRYLLRLRLEESCSLLRSTNHSMSQIAHIAGFSSSSYFSQIFRKTFGISPSDYRRGMPINLHRQAEQEDA